MSKVERQGFEINIFAYCVPVGLQVTLNIYSYENCAFHILHSRVPAYSLRTLTSWYNHRTNLHRWRVVRYYTDRVKGQLAMLDQLDIIGKTSEFARVFGIEFFDVLSRGSQVSISLSLSSVSLLSHLNTYGPAPLIHMWMFFSYCIIELRRQHFIYPYW